jgi:Subunit ChlI of Mg-chelatase
MAAVGQSRQGALGSCPTPSRTSDQFEPRLDAGLTPGAERARVLAAVRSAAVLGIDAYDVTVEVDAALGLPAWTIVGLAAGAVKESRERVNAAILNAGFALPPRRVTVNLAPAR